jgi:hypothetical protein
MYTKKLAEYIAFIFRQSFADTRANIPMETQDNWVILLNRLDWDNVILPEKICGFKLMVCSIYGRTFDLAIPQEDFCDKQVSRFVRAFYDNQETFIFSESWVEPT